MSLTPSTSAGQSRATKSAASKKSAHPTYQAMIQQGLTSIKGKGASRQALLKYVMQNFNVGQDAKAVNTHLKLAMKSGLEKGVLVQSSGKGATGSIKLAKPTPAAKSAKVATKPKAAVKKPKATAAKVSAVKKTAKPKKVSLGKSTAKAKKPSLTKKPSIAKKSTAKVSKAKATKTTLKKATATKTKATKAKVAKPKVTKSTAKPKKIVKKK